MSAQEPTCCHPAFHELGVHAPTSGPALTPAIATEAGHRLRQLVIALLARLLIGRGRHV